MLPESGERSIGATAECDLMHVYNGCDVCVHVDAELQNPAIATEIWLSENNKTLVVADWKGLESMSVLRLPWFDRQPATGQQLVRFVTFYELL
jgi:hypothetical protein